jgi:hypothetical protein
MSQRKLSAAPQMSRKPGGRHDQASLRPDDRIKKAAPVEVRRLSLA